MSGEVQSEADRLLKMPCEDMFAHLATFDRVNARKREARDGDNPHASDGRE